jgi:adenylylsulfate kinase (apsK)
MKFLYPVDSRISYERRKKRLKQEPKLIWLTGLSGSGKSTLASGLEYYLFESGFKVYLLDGDNIRNGINKDLGFSSADRTENIRRIAEVSKLMLDAGLIIISAFISPFRDDREMVREIVGEDRFTEVFIDCPLEVCEKRDTKGLYKKARQGFIRDFTGIGSPYEIPEHPNLVLHTDKETIEESLAKLINHVEARLLVESL